MKRNLALLKLSDIKIITSANPNREQVIDSYFEESEIIRNPLPVARIKGKNEYYLLEDAAILNSLDKIEIEYAPVQIFNISSVFKFDLALYIGNDIMNLLDKFNRLFPRALIMSTEDKSGSDLNDGFLVSIDHKNHPVVFLSFRRNNPHLIPVSFLNFLKFVSSHSRIHSSAYPFMIKSRNIKGFTTVGTIKAAKPDIRELLNTVELGHRFPSSALHFKLDNRILGLDFPLGILKSDVSQTEKEKFYFDLVNFRLSSGFSENLGNNAYLLNY